MFASSLRHATVLALVVAASAASSACGGSSPPPPVPPGGVRIASIAIDGNDALDDEPLREGLALERMRETGQEFDPYLVQVDRERLRGVYLRRGYFQVEVEPEVDRHPDRAAIRYRVDEGPRARLARVEFGGVPPGVDVEELRELVPLDDGDHFVYEAYDEIKPQVLRAVVDAGYAHARMEASVAADTVRNEAIIRFEFEPGPPTRFGEIALRGADGTLADAARARLLAREGQPYSATALADSQDALYAMGRFASVRIDPERSEETTVIPVTISLTRAPPNEVRLGGGVGVNPTAYEVRGRASYRIAGWPVPLTSTLVELRPAYVLLRDDNSPQPRVEARAVLERMDLFGRPFLNGEVEASFSYLALEAYTSVGPRTRLGVRTPLLTRWIGRRLEVGANWELEVLGFSRVDEAVDAATQMRLGLEGPYRLGLFDQSVSLDLRDDPVTPRYGAYAEVRVEEGTRAAGGEFDYLRVTPELRGYLPLGSMVLAARARVGGFRGDLPVTQRYFAGGASSQRGFAERNLAPTVMNEVDGEVFTAPIGGGAMVESSLELRFPITTYKDLAIGGVTFVDGADVTETYGELEPLDQHWAAGVGLRLGTPIGPVRADLGVRLNRTGPGEPRPGERFAFHLSLGEAF